MLFLELSGFTQAIPEYFEDEETGIMKEDRPPLFDRLKSAMEDLSLYAKGEKELVETRLSLPDPPRTYLAQDVPSLRKKLGLSQASLAAVMHVSIKTVQGWEQGLRAPSGVASRFLQVLEEPDSFSSVLRGQAAPSKARGKRSVAT